MMTIFLIALLVCAYLLLGVAVGAVIQLAMDEYHFLRLEEMGFFTLLWPLFVAGGTVFCVVYTLGWVSRRIEEQTFSRGQWGK